jgi:hypothetical protein
VSKPRHAHPVADNEAGTAIPDKVNHTHHLVTRDNQAILGRKVALGQMEIGATDATGADANADLPVPGNRHDTFNAPERPCVDRPRPIDGPGPHHFGHHTHLLARLGIASEPLKIPGQATSP